MNSASAHRNLGQLIVPWALLTSAAIGLTMLPQAALGQQYNVIYLDPNAVEAQWTEERLRKAQPMPRLRPVYDDSLRPSHRSYLSPRQDRADPITLSHEALPLFDLGDALETYLYDVDDASEEHDGRLARQSPWRPSSTHSKAATKREAPFTTSRVFPAAALAEMPLIRIGKLYFYFAHNTIDKDRDGACTAAVVERRLVLTAAHCVFDPWQGGYVRALLFAAGYDRGKALGGRWKARSFLEAPSFSEGGGVLDVLRENFADFALVELQDENFDGRRMAIGDVLGHFNLRINESIGNHIASFGYPENLDHARRLQQTNAQFYGSTSPYGWLHGSFQGGGSSGGPVIRDFGIPAIGQTGEHNIVLGVNSYFWDDDPTVNGVSVLNEEFLNIFVHMCKLRRGNCNARTTAAAANRMTAQISN